MFKFPLGEVSFNCDRITVKFTGGRIVEYAPRFSVPPMNLWEVFKSFEKEPTVEFFWSNIYTLPYKIIKK